MPRPKQIMKHADIKLFSEGLKRLVDKVQEQTRKISALEADIAVLRSARARGRRKTSNCTPSRTTSNGARPASWGTLLESALAKKVLAAVQSAKGGLTTVEIGQKLKVPKAQVKRITHGFKRKGTFKVKGIKRSARYVVR
jgi:hypothetical protein